MSSKSAKSHPSSTLPNNTTKAGVVVETMSAPNPFCPNTRGVCCLMVLVNLAIILVAIGFIIVLQLHDPTFVSRPTATNYGGGNDVPLCRRSGTLASSFSASDFSRSSVRLCIACAFVKRAHIQNPVSLPKASSTGLIIGKRYQAITDRVHSTVYHAVALLMVAKLLSFIYGKKMSVIFVHNPYIHRISRSPR